MGLDLLTNRLHLTLAQIGARHLHNISPTLGQLLELRIAEEDELEHFLAPIRANMETRSLANRVLVSTQEPFCGPFQQ